jgi:hypothetical protein
MLKEIDQKQIKHEYVIDYLMLIVLINELLEKFLLKLEENVEKNDKMLEYLTLLFVVEVSEV